MSAAPISIRDRASEASEVYPSHQVYVVLSIPPRLLSTLVISSIALGSLPVCAVCKVSSNDSRAVLKALSLRASNQLIT